MEPATLVLYVAIAAALILIITAVVKSITVVRQAEAAVIERLGRYQRTAAPGLTFLVPFIDRIRERVALWEQVVSESHAPMRLPGRSALRPITTWTNSWRGRTSMPSPC